MMTMRILILLFAAGMTPAVADVTDCANCYQEGLDAWQGGELESALRLFERGCEQDDGAACDAVFRMLSRGEGAPEDDTQAISFGLRSCDLGYWKGCENAEALAKAMQKEPAKEQDKGWSFSGENLSFSTRKEPTEKGDSSASTSIASMQIGKGSETATFSDVQSSCGMFRLTLAFGSAAAYVRQCLGDTDTRRVTLVAEDGRITLSSVEPDDSVGQCVINALGRARLEGLSCRLETSVSR